MSKVLLITGASRGIGAATATIAASRGYAVGVNYRANAAAAEAVVRGIRDAGGTAEAIQGDVAVEADIRRMFAINVIGAMLCAQAAVRRLSTAHGGRGGAIVNVSSVASRIGSNGEYVDYAASKAAIDTFTLGLAKEVVGEGIRVNAVRPGIVRTGIHASGGQPDRLERIAPLVPMLRPGEPDEIAHAILWLLSDEASYVTGVCLDAAGGR